jgi:hypothetical protein
MNQQQNTKQINSHTDTNINTNTNSSSATAAHQLNEQLPTPNLHMQTSMNKLPSNTSIHSHADTEAYNHAHPDNQINSNNLTTEDVEDNSFPSSSLSSSFDSLHITQQTSHSSFTQTYGTAAGSTISSDSEEEAKTHNNILHTI